MTLENFFLNRPVKFFFFQNPSSSKSFPVQSFWPKIQVGAFQELNAWSIIWKVGECKWLQVEIAFTAATYIFGTATLFRKTNFM